MKEKSELYNLVEKYGSDKNLSGYTPTYEVIFSKVKDKVKNILEIGLGTLDPSIPSTFVGNPHHYPHYKQGGSLRVWRDYFTNAQVHGVDIAKDCMFTEDRIKTYLFDSSNKDSADYYLNDIKFDIIIDDGNHDPKFQIKTLSNLINKLSENGIYIIEDIGGYGGTEELLVDYKEKLEELTKGYKITNNGNHIVITKEEIKQETKEEIKEETSNKNYTIVSGLWDLSREGRGFEDHYIPRFKEFLKIDAPMILFLPEELHDIVWETRDTSNTYVKKFELEDIKLLYAPFWDKTQEIRTSKKWLDITGPGGWLPSSPQASLEYYNPIVMSKMFMLHDASVYNVFDTEYFYWLDAGITNTVPETHLVNDKCLDKLNKYGDPFLFLSYPYIGAGEIHGFDQKGMDRYGGEPVQYVCRGGLFGGHKDQISQANNTYYSFLQASLGEGLMGTEESIFAIMAHKEPYFYRRYELDGNGLIVKFTEALINNKVKLAKLSKPKPKLIKNNKLDTSKLKTNLYILTFNFPEQVLHTIESMKKVPEWLEKPHLVLLDNSTDKKAQQDNKEIAKEYNFEYIWLEGNKGICGGRQAAAEHFHKSDADYYFFFEDDMTSNPPSLKGQFCRNGLRKYIPNLYMVLHQIMLKEDYDYLKMSFTEVYWDNNVQTSWYNVPQDVRTKYWPDYDQLPITGRDENAPRTKFNVINNHAGVAYIDGEITYTNWPMIMSKKGNQKVFIDTKWEHPYEQTWMSHVFQKQKEGEIKAGVILASPIWHERIKFYKPEERREN